MLYSSVKCHENISKCSKLHDTQEINKTTIFDVQWTIIPKVVKSELWFLSFAYRLVGHFISVKFQFHENISNDFQTQGRTISTDFIVHRAIIQKVVKPELWLLSSHHENIPI